MSFGLPRAIDVAGCIVVLYVVHAPNEIGGPVSAVPSSVKYDCGAAIRGTGTSEMRGPSASGAARGSASHGFGSPGIQAVGSTSSCGRMVVAASESSSGIVEGVDDRPWSLCF